MRNTKPKPKIDRRAQSGFSLIEVLVVVALLIVLGSISFISMVPVLKQQRVNTAYNIVLGAMRMARGNAIAQGTSYSVTFSSSATPNTVTVAPTLSGGFQGQQVSVTYKLPTDIVFTAQSGLPTAAAAVPDGFGGGTSAIDFGYTGSNTTGGLNYVYFCPDGSAQSDTTGKCTGSWDGGVIYLARSGELLSSRAVTLWGGTGRIHGWRLYPKSGGGYQWVRQ